MKKIIEERDLIRVAEEILSNCRMLSFADEESAENDLSFYVPRIRRSAEDLKGIAKVCPPATTTTTTTGGMK